MRKHNIEQRTDEWFHLRKGKITGTTLKLIMGTPKARQEAVYEIVAQRLTVGVDSEYENPMARGNRLEPDAIAMFELETGKSVEQIGLAESDDESNIAISPDGIIAETNETEQVEAKCMGGKNHVKMWFTDVVPSEYYWQVIQYFVVNDNLEILYFIGYNPDIPSHPLHIIEVRREDILEDILTHSKRERSRLALVEPEPIIQVDPFLTRIRDLLGDFRAKVSVILSDREAIMFFELVRGMDTREVARYFILMLFLAMEGLIGLEQVEDDIKLSRISANEHGES